MHLDSSFYDESAQWAESHHSHWHLALEQGPSVAWIFIATGVGEVAGSIFANTPRPLAVQELSSARKQLLEDRRRIRRLSVFASAFLPGRGVAPEQTALVRGYGQRVSPPPGLECVRVTPSEALDQSDVRPCVRLPPDSDDSHFSAFLQHAVSYTMHNVIVQRHVSSRLAWAQRVLGRGVRAEREQHDEARMAELGEAYLTRGLAQAWRLAGVMTRKPLGPKRRRMDAVMSTRPSLAAWQPFLAAGGPQGGCKAELLASFPPIPVLHIDCPPEHCIHAARGDLRRVTKYICRGKGRKMPSDNDAPMEVWRLLLEGPSSPSKKGWDSPCRTPPRSSRACSTGCSASSEAQDMSQSSSTGAELGAYLSTT